MNVLKRVAIVGMLLLMIVALTGCANINYDIKINKDGSGEVSYIMGYNKQMLASMGADVSTMEDSFAESKKSAEAEGYTTEKFEDDATYGFKAYKHVNNIQEEFNMQNVVGEATKDAKQEGIKYEKNILKTKIYQKDTIDLSSLSSTDAGGDSSEKAMANAMLSQMKLSYKITLPFKVGDTNATNVSEDRKALTWDLQVGKSNEIHFTAEENYTMYAILAGAIVLVIILTVVIVKVTKKSKEKKEIF